VAGSKISEFWGHFWAFLGGPYPPFFGAKKCQNWGSTGVKWWEFCKNLQKFAKKRPSERFRAEHSSPKKPFSRGGVRVAETRQFIQY